MPAKTEVVYTFPNGFQKEAESMYGWLRHYSLTPSWGHTKGYQEICLPHSEVACLRKMQESNPARFGNPPRPVYVWFCVYQGRHLITATSYLQPMTPEEVRKSLINHDGYPDDIRVTKAKHQNAPTAGRKLWALA